MPLSARASYEEPKELLQLLQTPGGKALASSWAPYLAVLNLRVLAVADAATATADGSSIAGRSGRGVVEDPLMEAISEGGEDGRSEGSSAKDITAGAGAGEGTGKDPTVQQQQQQQGKYSAGGGCGVDAASKGQDQGSKTGSALTSTGRKVRGGGGAETKEKGAVSGKDQMAQQQQQDLVLTEEQRSAFKHLVALALEPSRRLAQQQQQRAASATAARKVRPSQGTSAAAGAVGSYGSPNSVALQQLQQQEKQERQRQQQQREEQKCHQQQQLCCHLVRQVGLLRLVVKEVVTAGPEQVRSKRNCAVRDCMVWMLDLAGHPDDLALSFL